MFDISETIFSKFIEICRKNKLICSGDALIIAVSGGSDSIALLDLVRRYTATGIDADMRVAHFNHKLRVEADEEAQYVADVCKNLGLDFVSAECPPEINLNTAPDGIHSAARRIRYKFLIEEARKFKLLNCKVVKIITGHQQDDQLETILMRLIQGSGVDGLKGISQIEFLSEYEDIIIIRPLLNFSREELMDYCKARELKFFEDRTNLDERYPRVFIRNQILPRIKAHFGKGGYEGILRSASLIGLAAEEIEGQIDRSFNKTLKSISPEAICLDYSRYISYNNIVRLGMLQISARMVWRSLNFDGAPRISFKRCLAADNAIKHNNKGVIQLGEGLCVQTWKNEIYLFFNYIPCWEYYITIGDAVDIPFVGRLEVSLSELKQSLKPPSEGSLYLNAEKIGARPLLIRNTRLGDKMKPLGSNYYCNVFDLLREANIPPHRRKLMPVVIIDSEIVALPPFRISEDFKLLKNNCNALILNFNPAHTKK